LTQQLTSARRPSPGAYVQVIETVYDLTLQGGGTVNVLTGTDGADIQVGADADDWIYGGLGNDQLLDGAAGTDGVFGGEGNDILVLGMATTLVGVGPATILFLRVLKTIFCLAASGTIGFTVGVGRTV
jgi:Ca2+-binding RTX toxin-like protein